MSRPDGPHCGGCPLEFRGSGFMRVDGEGHSGVMLIAEALGKNEARHNLPFIGAAGFLLRNVIKRIVKLDRDDFWMANTIFCQPPRNFLRGAPYEARAIEHCSPHLDAAIVAKKPKVIVPLGDVALQRILGLTGIKTYLGYAYWSERYTCWVVPSWHPSFIMQGNQRLQPVLGHNIRKAVAIAKAVGTEGAYTHEHPEIIQNPSPSRFKEWAEGYFKALRDDPTTRLAFDVETDYKAAKDESKLKDEEDNELKDGSFRINQISFAYKDDEAIAVEWSEANLPTIKALFATKGVKVVWNRPYDVPRINHNGVTINGKIRDSMVAWHTLHSDMDKSLGGVTPYYCPRFPEWKSQSDLDGGWYYSGMDSLSLLRNDAGIMRDLEREGLIDFFTTYVEGPRPILDDMEAAGMLVDTAAQVTLSERMKGEMDTLDDSMQKHVPASIRNLHPTEGYKKDPEDTRGMRRVTIPDQHWTVCPGCKSKNPTKVHFKKYKAKRSLHKNTKCSGLTPTKMSGDEKRWAKILPFKPSNKQMVRYAQYKKYTVPKNYKTDAYTMDEEALSRLIKKYPKEQLFPLVLEHRSVQKMYGLYGPDGILIGDDGRVHTHFTDNPNTFRFASYGPNMQNIPRPGDVDDPGFGKYIRNLFIARSGWILGARDYSGIEAVLVGYLAGDRDYVRLAKMGVHDYFNAHLCVASGTLKSSELPDLSWSDEHLAGYLAELKIRLKPTRPVAKSAIHGGNYLETAFMLNRLHPELWKGQKNAQRVLDIYNEAFPKIGTWQKQTLTIAANQGYLRSPYGFALRLWDVYTFKKNNETLLWEKTLGSQAKAAVAFRPQHTAAVLMRGALVDIGENWVREFMRLTIHDELLWECPKRKQEAVDEAVAVIMEKPQTGLPLNPDWNMGEYLSIGTEGKQGPRWGEMK